ncbi:MAG TPA: hydantoinase B/oxoprolinase family protein [Pirellulales bacterium]|nr:hydantoinase B/oxoprolinase family protein [Pirellulales bacterium]
MSIHPWEFWIDVGGTFTDCLARRPDGSLARLKLLSSGVTKGAAAVGSSRNSVVDPARSSDPERFFGGYELRLLDGDGRIVATTKVSDFNRATGELRLAEPLPLAPRAGQAYELVSQDEAPIVAIRYLLGLSREAPIPPVVVRLGTTRGTNALLTRRGAKTAFVTTRGFGDILKIGYQNRPRLFDLDIRKPVPLFAAVVEIDERITAAGDVLIPPDPAKIRAQLAAIKERGIESLAICLLHAFAHPAHEQLVTRIARESGFDEISTSSHVAPLIKIVSRGDTTVMDAYLNPVLRAYVESLRRSLGSGELRIMTSAGGLVTAERFVGKDSILSGPAGGVVGFSRAARAAGFERAIGFDMGGTSTDVARFDGRCELEYETEKAGVRVVAPMLAIETVAAGGGSICGFDGVKLVVGPDSAGADPGPACYGGGGPLAVTDLNFFLGKILPEHFPFPLDRPAVEARLATLAETIRVATERGFQPRELCDGFLRVANSNMVKAIQTISLAKGCDPRDYVLVAFGGAAGQHACAVARELGMRQVLLHPDAGILSAYGIGLADVTRHRAAGVYQPYGEAALADLAPTVERLVGEARREVLAEGIAPERIEVRRSLDIRYRGLDAWLTIAGPAMWDGLPRPSSATDGQGRPSHGEFSGNSSAGAAQRPSSFSFAEAYENEHQKLYGYRHEGRALEIVALRVEVIGRTADYDAPTQVPRPGDPRPECTVTAYFDAVAHETQVFDRATLQPGDRLRGPAIVYEKLATTVVDPGWRAEVLGRGELLLCDEGSSDVGSGGRREVSTDADPVMLEIFNHQFAGIAEQMGITLRNTSSSVNVKERLDFSCAVFTAAGELVVNAPHIPVHLGAMGETVKRILADNPGLAAGDVFVTNDPYRGGSHLPDVTVVTPVHDTASGRLLFFTASRAHHAEIGGIRPGSMPPFSRNLAEEGVLIRNFKLVEAGRSRIDALGELLLAGPYPTRNVADNLADVAAQVAANNQGARDLGRLVERYGLSVVTAYMRHIQAAAERKMRAALARLPDGDHRFLDHLDDGSPIAVTISVAGDSAVIDFTGTGSVLAGNLNANRAIVTAAVMYCLRCLIAEDIPLNQGVLAPVRIILPEGLLNPPEGPTPATSAAMVGGNVETSQRVVDTLLGALGVAAASQGTMNNLVFGDATFGYYETICGGSGATPQFAGADAVHTHMTNTRLTDPEVLERRYPVRLHEFSIRRGSGGDGRRRGGDGIIRRIEFLRDLDLSMLSQRRGPYPPYGVAGGRPGALGRDTLTRADGTREALSGQVQFVARAGDVLTIETPGGGGYGNSFLQAN